MPPKNLIVITADEMRGDAPGSMGNSAGRSPNPDRPADGGVVFRSHYCVHGKRVPSRISIVRCGPGSTGPRYRASRGARASRRSTSAIPEAMARAKVVRTERWRLVVRLAGGNELYGLQSAPWKLDNIFDEPGNGETKLELQQRMIEWCLRTDTDRPYQNEVPA